MSYQPRIATNGSRVHDVCCSLAEANVPKAGAIAEHVDAVGCCTTFACLSSHFFKKNRNDMSGVIEKYLWEFGDGETSTEKNPEHVYKMPGVYTVKLYVKNNKAINNKPKRTDFEDFDRMLKGACLGLYIILGFCLSYLIFLILSFYISFPKPIFLPIINSFPSVYCEANSESNYQNDNRCYINSNRQYLSSFSKKTFSNREYSNGCTYHNSINSNHSGQYDLLYLISFFFNSNNFYNRFIHKECHSNEC